MSPGWEQGQWDKPCVMSPQSCPASPDETWKIFSGGCRQGGFEMCYGSNTFLHSPNLV